MVQLPPLQHDPLQGDPFESQGLAQTKVGGRLFITAQIELSSGPGPVRFMAAG